MKAAVHTSYGPADVVRIAEVDKPTPKDNEVLVKVHALISRFFTGLIRPRATTARLRGCRLA